MSRPPAPGKARLFVSAGHDIGLRPGDVVGAIANECDLSGADIGPILISERFTLVEIPALAISSTDCRERHRRGEPVWYLVPDGVVQYIAKHNLYPPANPEDSPCPRTDRLRPAG